MFNFSNQDISLTIGPPYLLLCNPIDNIHLGVTVSQNLYLGCSLYFMLKKRETFYYFFHL